MDSTSFKSYFRFSFNLTFILFLAFQLISCTNIGNHAFDEPESNKPISSPNLEMIVYRDILDSLIDYGFYFQPPPSINSIKKLSSQKDWKSEGRERISEHDTIKKYLFIQASLISLEKDYTDIKIYLSRNNLINDFLNPAPRYIFEDTIVDLNYLSEQISTVLIPGLVEDKEEYKERFGIRDGKLYLGNIILSRVLFNKNNSKACFFYSFAAGGTNGEHNLVYIEMMNKRWVVVDKVTLIVM
jgi:hypothetical protein